ncbi:hypothetical protein LTR56_011622 [Elasticomyces elasticus]|nr:hypothetical protein LTR56_011622 [Elasticomyces elasticus]KAK3647972.1 hypothetical protein LTR22_013585 [Elasticomyces elasticus]KAK4905343.1 hypothetical protein LTR49_025366 [Elasticomyces elasticus]KAK5765345.1 hypothetical protein LTS12_004602 [Elasticomyces elasticus]
MDGHTIMARGVADFDFYPYNPSKAGGWIFVVLFAIGAIVHLAYIVPYRAWFFIPFVLGAGAETGGYYGRAWAHNNIRLSDPYLLQLFLIIGATPLLSATIYMSLSRLIRALDATEYSIVRVSWISKIYVVIDIVCLVLQVIGTVTVAYGGDGEQQKAIKLVAGGLIAQLVAFMIFMILALIVHIRLRRNPTHISGSSDIRWQKYFWALYATSTLVLIRNLVRIFEFLQGSDSTIIKHEVFLYVFDATPMFLVVLILAVVHPGRLMKSARGVFKLDGLDGDRSRDYLVSDRHALDLAEVPDPRDRMA